jgi:hypothetical protein
MFPWRSDQPDLFPLGVMGGWEAGRQLSAFTSLNILALPQLKAQASFDVWNLTNIDPSVAI